MEGMLDTCSALFEANQYDKVIKCCDDFLKMKPKSGRAWHLKGLAYQKKGDVERAYGSFKKAADIEESDPANYYAMAMLLYNERRFNEALQLFHKCNAVSSRVDHHFMIAVTSLMLNRLADSETALRAAFSMDKKAAAKVISRFFDRHYKTDKTLTEKDKANMKAQIDKLMKGK